MMIEAAGVLFLSDQGKVLFLKRSDTGEWAFPGGHIEQDESPLQAAIRECNEEIGIIPTEANQAGPKPPHQGLRLLWQRITPEVNYITFIQDCAEFMPTLNEEHAAFIWRRADNPPGPLHPGVQEVLEMRMTQFTTDRAMKFYTTDQLGPKQSTTPEGFLLCEDVPIGRIGTFYYRGDGIEVPIRSRPGSGGIVQVEREDSEVFRPEAILSYAGKPVTLDHPPGGLDVNPKNHRLFAVGTVMHPRRGDGGQDDLLLADLLITDPDIIKAIRAGKLRQVSSGYDCDYEETSPGRGRQYGIIGNHVALVDKGRAGPRCSIGDSAMAIRKTLKTSVARIFSHGDTQIAELREAFANKDEAAFEALLTKVLTVDAAAEPGGEMHLHVHDENDTGMGDLADAIGEILARLDDAEGITGDAAMCADSRMKDGRMKDSYKRTRDKRMADKITRDAAAASEKEKADKEKADTAMRDAAAGKEPDKDEKEGKGNARDSVTLQVTYQETLSRAEILAPGIKFPTFDRRADFDLTDQALLALRRKALGKALENDDTSAIIKPLTGDSPDLRGMAPDALTAMFIGASELVKQRNAGGGARDTGKDATPGGYMTFGGTAKIPTIAELNARSKAIWANQSAH